MQEPTILNKETVKQWTDEQIIKYLKEFWGVDEFVFECFMSEIPLLVKNKENYIGSLSQFRAIEKGEKISYPDIVDNKFIFFNIKKISSIYIKKGWYKVSLRLADREYREKYDNPFLMTPVWKSLKPVYINHELKAKRNDISQTKKTINIKAETSEEILLKDPRTSSLIKKWGKSIFRLVGVYTVSKGGAVSIECVRKTNFSRLENTPLSIKLDKPLRGFENGDCIEFDWKYENDKDYKITVNPFASLKIKKLSPQEIITRLYMGAITNEDRSTDLAYNGIETNRINISGQDRNTFIYELLQNANDYPQKDSKGNKIPVHVEFEFEGDYLYFRHTGAKFSVQNILGICGIGEKEKIDNIETIGYKGVGFKNVFIDCDYVYIKTGEFSFKFDKSKIKRSSVSFETTPIWATGIPIVMKSSFEKNKEYNVQIALKPRDKSIIHLAKDGYIDRFLEAFSDPRIIIFIPWIDSVTVKIPGREAIECTRKGNEGDWVVSNPNDLKSEIAPEIKTKIAELIDSHKGRMPEKFKFKTETSVSFACKVANKTLLTVDNSRIYCYLPTKDSWGFKFLMNTDMIPTGPRDGIEQQEYWNIEYSEIAGRAFFKWIKQLLEHGYDYDSVFSLIPDFKTCKIGRNEDHVNMICRFQKGFEECINTEPLVPVCGANNTIEYACIKNIILDNTSVTGNDVFEDRVFLSFTNMNGKLPHPSLRKSSNFNKLLSLYGEKSLRFEKSNLIGLFQNDDFIKWLKEDNNNAQWINYFVANYPKDYSDLSMFIGEHDKSELYKVGELYYNIDEALEYLSAFADILPRLSKSTREKCKLLEKEENLAKFRHYSAKDLINNFLYSEANTAATQETLTEKDNSVRFVTYIAINKVDAKNLINKIPLIDIDEKLIPTDTSLNLRELFFNSPYVSNIRKESWFCYDWVTILHDDYYTNSVVKVYLELYNISELDDKYIINEVLADGNCCDDIKKKIGDSIDISKSFINYLFIHKDVIKGFIEKSDSLEKKGISFNRFSKYGLFFEDGNGNVNYYSASDEKVFNQINDNYLHYEWFDNSWMSHISDDYYKDLDEAGKKEMASFLKRYFGLCDLTDGFFKYLVKKHISEINESIKKDIEINLSFWNFLGKYQWDNNSKEADIFRNSPMLILGEDLPIVISERVNLFFYNEELEEMNDSSWMPQNHLTILSNEYDENQELRSLFGLFGFKTYDPQKFSNFFEDIIVDQSIPTVVPEIVNATKFKVLLDTKDRCVDFHNFMSKKYTLLNDIDKVLLNGAPIYVYGKDEPRRLSLSNNCFILGNDKFGVLNKCASGLLPEINAIDSAFITEGNLAYWNDVQGSIILDDEALCCWIEKNAATLGQTIQDREKNILFWSWLFDNGIKAQAKISRLKVLPIISYSTRNETNEESAPTMTCLSTTEVYMSNSYMGQAQIEDFARNHGKNTFVSSAYIRDNDNVEEWRRFFKNLGVKDDVKEVIYSIIKNDLPTLKDKQLPWVLVDQYSNELADKDTFDSLAIKLKELQVETTTAGVFVSIANALRITVDDYSQKEPFKMVKLAGEISRDYYQDESIRNLIIKIADSAGTKKITELQQWIDAKVDQFILIQNANNNLIQKDDHLAFFKEMLNHSDYTIKRKSEIKLYDRGGDLTKSVDLYLGTKYECKCDFERFGITKKYVSDVYLKYGDVKEVSQLLLSMGCQDRFKDNSVDIQHLKFKNFSIYFWCLYVGSKDPEIISTINDMVKNGVFNDVECIPSQSGAMKKASDLYASSLKDYMKYIPKYEDKVIDEGMQSSEPFDKLCKQCKNSLSLSDIIQFLINSETDNSKRANALRWLLDDSSEEKPTWVATYLSQKNAYWKNGQGGNSHVSSLIAIDPNKCNQAYVFKSSPRVIDISFFPKGKELDVCKMFNIKVYTDDDLKPNPVTSLEGSQTTIVTNEIYRRLLLVIAYRYKNEWSEKFEFMKQKMQDVEFFLCESISYGFSDLSIDNEDFYFDPSNKTFYYVDSWQDKKVYESFVKKLCDYLGMDLDYRECKSKLDENYKGEKVVDYLNQNCRDLYDDENFISLLKKYWKEIFGLLDIKDEKEPEIVVERPIEEVKPKYFENELKDLQRERQQEESQVEQKEKTSEGNNSGSSVGSQENAASPSQESATSGHSNSTNNDHASSNTQSTGGNSGGGNSSAGSQFTSSQRSSQRDWTKRYEPKVKTKEEIEILKYDASAKSFSTKEPDENEINAVNKILGGVLSAEEIVTTNYLAQLRFWEDLQNRGYEIANTSQADFLRDVKEDKDYDLTDGKYIHRCYAKGGLLNISPSIWNMITNDRCIVCVFVGDKVNEFFYIRNKQDLLDWIAKDAIIIKLTGTKKVEAVNRLYSEILSDTQGTAYTLIRVAYNETYNSLFADIEYNNYNQTEINDDDY